MASKNELCTAICTALFGVFVRSANFVNSEILGVASDAPWAIIFSRVDNIARHPAQLYEAFAYLIIFLILFFVYKKSKDKTPQGSLFGLFLILIFTARFLVESVKVKQAAYDSILALNTGQILSIPFFIAGIILLFWSLSSKKKQK